MNLRPSGYEPDELPDCSTPRCYFYAVSRVALDLISLRVMSPTSYQTALPRDIGAGDRDRTGTGLLPRDFKSRASANSATPTCGFI